MLSLSTASVSLPLTHALKIFVGFLSYCLKARFWLSSELYNTNSHLRVAARLISIVHWSLTFQGNRCNQLVDSMFVSQLSYKKTMYNSDVTLQKSHITLTKCGVEITNNSREKWNSLSVSVSLTVSHWRFRNTHHWKSILECLVTLKTILPFFDSSQLHI